MDRTYDILLVGQVLIPTELSEHIGADKQDRTVISTMARSRNSHYTISANLLASPEGFEPSQMA